MKNKNPSRSDDKWKENRIKALKRDDRTCQRCGDDVGLEADRDVKTAHVHHKTPLSDGGSHDLENLVAYCEDCHAIAHGAAEDEEERGSSGRRRALLTDRERELISDEDRDDEHYVAISRVRTKIKEELPQDLEIMKKNHPGLYQELLEEVCDDE